jgi:N-acetylglucosamine-6-sulfatase
VLTDLALGWLKQRREKPFLLYLSFKAPHFPFEPAPRHKGRHDKVPVRHPDTAF